MKNVVSRTVPFPLLLLILTLFFNIQITEAAVFTPNTTQELIDDITTSNLNSEDDIINLRPGVVYSITGLETGVPFNDGVNGNTGLPIISPIILNESLTINGNGATIQRDPSLFLTNPCSGTGLKFRIFQTGAQSNVTLNNVIIQNGCADDTAGGILNERTMEIVDSTITNNEAQNAGGGIYNGGNLIVTTTTISANNVLVLLGLGGGGIYSDLSASNLDIVASTISDNTTIQGGSGVHIEALAMIENSTISGNTGGIAAIYATGRGALEISLLMVNSTISGNDIGIFNNIGLIFVSNSTITNNMTALRACPAFLMSCDSIFKNTIMAGNSANCVVGDDPIASFGGNFTDASGCIPGSPTTFDASTMLGPLQDNGGRTHTHELIQTISPVNPAIDSILVADCEDALDSSPITTDQRTFMRPFNTNCDAGAIELQPTGRFTIDLTSTPAGGKNFTMDGGPDYPDGCQFKNGFFLDDQEAISCVLPPDIYAVGQFELLPITATTIITCSEPATIDAFSATVDIADGDDVTCTFDNLNSGLPLDIIISGSGSGTVNTDPPDDNCLGNCSYLQPFKNIVTLTATPDPNSSFTGWSGASDCSGADPTIVVFMNTSFSTKTCTAEFTVELSSLSVDKMGVGTGTVTSTPVGINCGPGCNSQMFDFMINEMVTLTAAPEPGSLFIEWTGDCSGTDPVTNVTMDTAKSCIANFDALSLLTITKSGIGSGTVNSEPAGISCGGDCSESYSLNTVVFINAIPDADSVFAGFAGNADCMDGTVTMDASKTCDAVFSEESEVSLIISKDGTGGGTVTSPDGINCGTDCVESFNVGSNPSVTLTPIPDADSIFSGWSGDPDCSDGTVTVDDNLTCIATFNQNQFDVNIIINPSGTGAGTVTFTPNGAICPGDCSETFDANTTVTLTPNPATGSIFDGWTGDPDCLDGIIQNLVSDIICTATFTAQPGEDDPDGDSPGGDDPGEDDPEELMLETDLPEIMVDPNEDNIVSIPVEINNPNTGGTSVFLETRQTVAGAVFTVDLPQGFDLQDLVSTKGTCDINLGECQIGDIVPGETVTVVIDAIVPEQDGVYNLNYMVSTSSGQMFSGSATVTVESEGNIAIEDDNGSGCTLAGPNTNKANLLGLLLYFLIPSIVIIRRVFKKSTTANPYSG